MADWVDIDNTSIEPDAPLVSIIMFALRDNPKAIAEGAAGAPRIDHTALQTDIGMRDWVLGRTAGATAGSIGTYAMLARINDLTDNKVSANDLVPGSELRYTGRNVSSGETEWSFGGTPSGTWRAMGTANIDTSAERYLIWLRIS